MLTGLKIGIVGYGQMAEAVMGGLLSGGVVDPSQICVTGPRAEHANGLARKYGVGVSTSNAEAAKDADILVLAVKPQMADAVLDELANQVPESAVVVSIVAGTTLATLQEKLNHPSVIRAMPNTPGKIGAGVTAWTAAAAVTSSQREQAATLLGALGTSVYVDAERYIDMSTALSGTGPMYVLLFMESLVDAGVRMGLPRYLAQELVLQTVKGTAEYAQGSEDHLAKLRNDVTSPGGTSAAALDALDHAGFRPAITKAVLAAHARAVELGRKD